MILDKAPFTPFIVARDPQAPPKGLARPVLAIGNFDGLHRGHNVVIAQAQKLARQLGRPCALLTFEPHPVEFFKGRHSVFRLTSLEDKAREIEKLGLAGLIVLTFDGEFSNLSAHDFCDRILMRRLEISGAVVGYDFHFGANRSGTPAFLSGYGAQNGFAVEIVSKVSEDELGDLEAVSSSAIRKALAVGDVIFARKLLGRAWSVTGKVLAGRQIGRTIGFPTINLALDPSCRLRHGVYAVRVRIGARMLDGAASFGSRPTFDDGAPLLEVYLIDFSGDLYGQTVEVSFYAFVRPELKFESVDALVKRMQDDVNKIRALLQPTVEPLAI